MENLNDERFSRDVKYFSRWAKVRHLIADKIKESGFADRVVVDNNQGKPVDPFSGCIKPNGAFAVEFVNGMPSRIYSEYGDTPICSIYRDAPVATAKHKLNIITAKKELFNNLKTTFGMVRVESSQNPDLLENIDVYALTKIPGEKLRFPDQVKRADILDETLYSEPEKNVAYVDSVLKEVNQLQPEYAIKETKAKPQISAEESIALLGHKPLTDAQLENFNFGDFEPFNLDDLER